jgi:hypothetical protein
MRVAPLGAALFGTGARMHLRSLPRKSEALLATTFAATLFIVVVVLVAVRALVE